MALANVVFIIFLILQYVNIMRHKKNLYKIEIFCRDDKIRTCDPTPPRRVRYRAALHPENDGCKSN